MKYLNLFENFSSDYPFSITVVPTEKFKMRLKEIKNSDGKPSFLIGDEFRLGREKGGRFNLVKIATTPYELAAQKFDGKMFNGKQDDFWLSYSPENSEINVHTSRIFGEEFSFNNDKQIRSTDRRWAAAGDYRKFGLVWTGGYECKFPEGFEVGMEDERGYFKITRVEPFDKHAEKYINFL